MTVPIVITMGDACGIGPEIIAKAFASGAARGAVVLGDAGVMRRALALTGQRTSLALLQRASDAAGCPPNCVPLLQAADLPPGLLNAPLGQVDARAGAAAAAAEVGAGGG